MFANFFQHSMFLIVGLVPEARKRMLSFENVAHKSSLLSQRGCDPCCRLCAVQKANCGFTWASNRERWHPQKFPRTEALCESEECTCRGACADHQSWNTQTQRWKTVLLFPDMERGKSAATISGKISQCFHCSTMMIAAQFEMISQRLILIFWLSPHVFQYEAEQGRVSVELELILLLFTCVHICQLIQSFCRMLRNESNKWLSWTLELSGHNLFGWTHQML